jgi:hypothetical protein
LAHHRVSQTEKTTHTTKITRATEAASLGGFARIAWVQSGPFGLKVFNGYRH